MMKSSRSRVASSSPAERLHARRVAQVEPEDLEPVPPLGEVRLPRRSASAESRGKRVVTIRCAPARSSLMPGLIADLHPPAGEQRHPAAQVGQLGALGEVELGARRAELIVEVMELGVLRLQT